MLRFGPGKDRLLSDPKLLGRWGEKKCERFLKRKGFKVVARNFSCRFGEIDLIMIDNDRALVFIEVKTRRDEEFITAQSAVTAAKRKRMRVVGDHFTKKYKIKNRPIRFDVVVVILGTEKQPEIRHYQGVIAG